MDKTYQYAQVMTNFDSAYNSSLKFKPQSTTYIPMSSSTSFYTLTNRPPSPLFRRSISPPPRRPISTGSGPKFNFDLYKMDEINDKYDEYYSSSSYRPISPPLSSSRIIHHYPIHSPSSSPTSTSQVLSKLRRINDELCQTLARSELVDQPSLSSPPPHYHIHHYPLSQHSYRKHRSRSSSEERSSPVQFEVSPKIHKARVTYKIHIPPPPPRRQERQHRKSSDRMPSSDIYSSDEPMVVDLYPTRDQGFVKQIKKHSDNDNPWVVNGTSVRRSSYSDTSISRPPETSKGLYYGDKSIKSYRRSSRDKERPPSSSRYQSPHVTSRSNSASSKRRVWQPPSKTIRNKPPKYFEPSLKSEYDRSNGKDIIDGTESEPIPHRKPISNRTTIRNGDPKFKKRIANAESKVKSAWEPSVTSLTQPIVKESKPPIPIEKTKSDTRPKSKVQSNPSEPTTPIKKVIPTPPTTTNTGRSSLNDVPSKPIFQSTPRTETDVHENDESVEDLFENESHTSEPSKRQELPRPPLPTEKTPVSTPQKPSTEPPKTTVPEPDKGTKSTIKDGVLISGDDTKNIRNQNPTPSPTTDVKSNNHDDEASEVHNTQPTPPKLPTTEQKTLPSKPNNKDNEPINDDDGADENDQEVERSFDIHKWLNDASKAILDPSRKGDALVPPSPPKPKPQPPPRPKAKSPPRRKAQPPSPISDENLYKPPFGPKRTDKKPANSSPPPSVPPPATTTTTTGKTDEVDDFFS